MKGARWCWLLSLAAACGFDRSGGGIGSGDGGVVADGGRDNDGGGGDGDGAAPAGYQKAITVPAPGGADLADFPLYVELEDADLMARAAADGSDIHFVAAAGGLLDHEVQRWDPGTGRLEAWVRVELLGGADTVVLLRYGDPDSAASPDPAGVWSGGFAAVWHLEQSPPADQLDSLGVRPGSPTGGMDDSDLVTGSLGRALAFDGGDDTIEFDNPLAGSTAHTVSAWVRQEATDDNDALVVLGTGACSEARWLHTRYDDQEVALGFYCDDWPDSGADIQGDGWTLLHWTYAAGESRLYVDGAAVGSPFAHGDPPDTQGADGFIGNVPASAGFGANMGLNGSVDEVRIATRVRSPAWVAAEFANQSDPASFYAVGPEEPR